MRCWACGSNDVSVQERVGSNMVMCDVCWERVSDEVVDNNDSGIEKEDKTDYDGRER